MKTMRALITHSSAALTIGCFAILLAGCGVSCDAIYCFPALADVRVARRPAGEVSRPCQTVHTPTRIVPMLIHAHRHHDHHHGDPGAV